jgi:hypothetical protein
MRRKAGLLSLMTLVVLALVPPTAQAQPPRTETIHTRFNETEHDVLCSGDRVPIHLRGKFVFHTTEFEDGRFHVTGTQVGRFTATDNGVTYNGHFTSWFGANGNSKSFTATFTLSATGTGDDGSKVHLHAVAHVTVNAKGDVTVRFERFRIRCG